MKPVPLGRERLQQMRIDQLLERPLSQVSRHAKESCHGLQTDVRTFGKAEQSECPVGPRAGIATAEQRAVIAHHEAGPDAEISGAKLIQPPVRVIQPGCQYTHAPPWPGIQAHRRDADRQRRAAAGRQHLADRLAFGSRAVPAGDAREQCRGILLAHDVQLHRLGGLEVRQ